MKRLFVCILSVLIMIPGVTAAFAAEGADATADEAGGAGYSVVSAVVSGSYDFKDDFYDSYLYDDDFYTEGVFRMRDHDPDVTLTLKDNGTGEELVYEKNDRTEWYISASVDYLLYETAQIGAVLIIDDLGGAYGIKDIEVPVTVTVESSLYSADHHKYPSYNANTVMYEGEDYTIEYDASSPESRAEITILKLPRIFVLEVYNVETGQIEFYDGDNGEFVFDKELVITGYDPSRGSFWFFVPCALVMDDGYELEFTLSVNAFPKASPTAEPGTAPGSSTDDSVYASPDSPDGSADGGAVQTGDPMAAYILAAAVLIAAAGLMLYARKRYRVR